ncbi:hypothetical protein BB561_004554 [Smittium simulii]|uniref:Uncharacterized protein n=1 Tax=Smittium simulii TaxID=133385 RepID=A0A2T9YFV1_9FUNG|nr:hypothetical protein BB561_004554 [Smittium simulii]
MVKNILLYMIVCLGSTFGLHMPNGIYREESELVTQFVQNSSSNGGLLESRNIGIFNTPQNQHKKYLMFKKEFNDTSALEGEAILKEKLRICLNEFRSIKDNTLTSVFVLNKKVKKDEDFGQAKLILEQIFLKYESTKNETIFCIYDVIKDFNDFKTKSKDFEKSFYNHISEFMDQRDNYVSTVQEIYIKYLSFKHLYPNHFIERFEETIKNLLDIID